MLVTKANFRVRPNTCSFRSMIFVLNCIGALGLMKGVFDVRNLQIDFCGRVEETSSAIYRINIQQAL